MTISAPPRFRTLATALLLLSTPAWAQVELPKDSPPAKVSQVVGLTEIAVEYSSPAVKGRHIWGGIIPYGKASPIPPNQASLIRFSKDVLLGDKPVAAGKYGLTVIPAKEFWTFVVRKEPEPTPGGREPTIGPEVARVAIKPNAIPHRERLTYLFSNFTDEKTLLDLEWDELRGSLPISTNTQKQILVGIGELETTWRSFANAARFMLENKKDFDAGLRYANQSLALKEDWYTLWIKAALLAAKHDFQAAIDNGQRAYELGQQQGEAFVLAPELSKALSDWRKKRGGSATPPQLAGPANEANGPTN